MREAPMLVCHCRGISDRQIRRLVKDGASSTRDVACATGAGMRCGGCRSNVTKVVNEAVEQEFRKAGSRVASEMLLPLSIPVEG
ncbi:MAG: (2Fe-2S)-binding protein [bacterium]|nr:(2Fe-2S)-binding protein [bacterium]